VKDLQKINVILWNMKLGVTVSMHLLLDHPPRIAPFGAKLFRIKFQINNSGDSKRVQAS
jgi:hypothetical protein